MSRPTMRRRAASFRRRPSFDAATRRTTLLFEALEQRALLTAGGLHPAAMTAFLRYGTSRADLSAQLDWSPIASAAASPAALITTSESEPNNSAATADAVPLGFDAGEDAAVDVTGTISAADSDYFALQLNAGDILGANLAGGGTALSLRSAADVELMGSDQDLGIFGYPSDSPLPTGGNAVLSWVVATTGTYYVRVTGGTGAYNLNLRVFRPTLESEVVGTHQTLFLDFDGETVDSSIWGGPGVVTLSPLSAFLTNWGLTAADEDAVIDAIIASVEESISADMRSRGNNGDFDATGVPGDFDIEILNSRDHADPFGQPHVSRVIIGGTIQELGISTIGIAESIDVGNFDTTESAVVLLDLLSGPADDPNSLNQYERQGGTTIVDVIAAGVGNITSHEAGHFFGNWHTDQFNASPNLMDQGGNLANIVGVGPDLIFGTGDDFDVDFITDVFVPNEGFTGSEDTLNVIAFGLSTGTVSSFSIGNATVLEGDSGTVGAVFVVTLSQSLPVALTVTYTTVDMTAVAGQDYVAQSGTLTFQPGGALTQSITISVLGDLDVESNETFLVRIAGLGGEEDEGVGTILNDDVDIVINDVSIVEGNGAAQNVVFTVSAIGDSNKVVTIRYSTVNDSASAAVDFLPQVGTLTLPAGVQSATIAVSVLADRLNEGTESFIVLLTSVQGARLRDGVGVATIFDDDPLPFLYVNDAFITTTAAGVLTAEFSVALDTASGREVVVPFFTSDGTALAGLDYSPQTGAVTFAPGATTRTVIVPVSTSNQPSANKKFYLNITAPLTASLADPQGAGTIVFADHPAGEYIADNGDAVHSKTGTWTNLTNTLAYGLDYDYASAGNGSAASTWQFTGIPNGSYEVFARWIPFGNRATNAPFTVYDRTTPLSTVIVNQQLAPAGEFSNGFTWQSLGTFQTTSNQLAIKLTNAANGYVIADAIRLVAGGVAAQSPEMDVAALDRSIGTGDVTPSTADATDFGTVPSLGVSVTHKFTITNNGNAPLHLTGSPAVTISGPQASDFTVVTQPASVVAPGGKTIFEVKFRATGTGTRTAVISIANDDTTENPYAFVVQGHLDEAGANPLAHNDALPQDVNGDNRVTPSDLLIVVNHLLAGPSATPQTAGFSSAAASTPPRYVDVNGDGRVSAIDGLMVINYLLARAASAKAAAAAPAAAEAAPLASPAVDAAIVSLDDDAPAETAVALVEAAPRQKEASAVSASAAPLLLAPSDPVSEEADEDQVVFDEVDVELTLLDL